MITRYSFGMIEIDGSVYRKDIIILPDGSIRHPWRRTAGHVLTAADIPDILAAAPACLVVGTGASGMMEPDAGFAAAIEARDINVTLLPTAQAVSEFNRMSVPPASCAGCFHLTC
jgi:hypothetical protein